MQTINKLRRRVTRAKVALVGAAAAALALGLTAVAGATEPETYSVKPVTESITSNITSNLPTILVVVGGLIAIGVVLHMVRKFSKSS